jgi:hypothetical protein
VFNDYSPSAYKHKFFSNINYEPSWTIFLSFLQKPS